MPCRPAVSPAPFRERRTRSRRGGLASPSRAERANKTVPRVRGRSCTAFHEPFEFLCMARAFRVGRRRRLTELFGGLPEMFGGAGRGSEDADRVQADGRTVRAA